jgi:hypothetical protein
MFKNDAFSSLFNVKLGVLTDFKYPVKKQKILLNNEAFLSRFFTLFKKMLFQTTMPSVNVKWLLFRADAFLPTMIF